MNALTRADDLLARMSLEEKIGQMTQVDQRALEPTDINRWFIGSVLSGGGANPEPNNPRNWADMVFAFQQAALETRLGIPLIYGVDAVHGHGNVVGATIFPHNIGLGASGDSELVKRIAQATAWEISATGVLWNFAPCVAVPQDIRWGRTYEGFSEDPDLVTRLAEAYITGLQGGQKFGAPGTTLACPKHFVGDGGTTWGTTQVYDWITNNQQAVNERYKIDQGDTQISEDQLRKIHLVPYRAAIHAGALSIMVSFSSWNGVKMHAHRRMLTEVLKGELGFMGFLVSDWQAIDQISPDYYECVVTSINAGLDMVMVPFEYQRFITTLKQAVQAGDIAENRIDDAVRRILFAKFKLGLFERKLGDEPGLDTLGSDDHRLLAREAVRKSIVLLKNDDLTLPVRKDISRLIIAGRAANDIGLQCGGWTIKWQGKAGAITTGTTLLEGLQAALPPAAEIVYDPAGQFEALADQPAELGMVVLAEEPYAEGFGDQAEISLSVEDVTLIERVRTRCERLVVVLFSGRPLILTEQLPLMDALVAAWLPGTEGQGVADVLCGEYSPTGRLPYKWPCSFSQIDQKDWRKETGKNAPLFPIGYGLDY